MDVESGVDRGRLGEGRAAAAGFVGIGALTLVTVPAIVVTAFPQVSIDVGVALGFGATVFGVAKACGLAYGLARWLTERVNSDTESPDRLVKPVVA